MDSEIERLVKDAKTVKRETIIIFQSDNGGSIYSYGNNQEGERSCNYPYRGYKNTLFEGGTLSPTMIYSTGKIQQSKLKLIIYWDLNFGMEN